MRMVLGVGDCFFTAAPLPGEFLSLRSAFFARLPQEDTGFGLAARLSATESNVNTKHQSSCDHVHMGVITHRGYL